MALAPAWFPKMCASGANLGRRLFVGVIAVPHWLRQKISLLDQLVNKLSPTPLRTNTLIVVAGDIDAVGGRLGELGREGLRLAGGKERVLANLEAVGHAG